MEKRPATRFDNYSADNSEKYGVDEALIQAIVNAESGYDPDALSDAGHRK